MCLSLSLNSETMLPDDLSQLKTLRRSQLVLHGAFLALLWPLDCMVVVRLVVRERKHATARGVWGHASHEIYGM